MGSGYAVGLGELGAVMSAADDAARLLESAKGALSSVGSGGLGVPVIDGALASLSTQAGQAVGALGKTARGISEAVGSARDTYRDAEDGGAAMFRDGSPAGSAGEALTGEAPAGRISDALVGGAR